MPDFEHFKSNGTVYTVKDAGAVRTNQGTAHAGEVLGINSSGNVVPQADSLWRPTVDPSGNLSWSKSTSSTAPTTQNIKGNQGIQGIQGNKGDDGVSPAVTVSEITGGHAVKITDAAHPSGQTFNVMDGRSGEKLYSSVSVPASSFAPDSTYEDFPYRAAVALTGVTSSMLPEVVFGVTDAMSGNFAPVAESYNGGVYIYTSSVPESAITIPTILCQIVNAT